MSNPIEVKVTANNMSVEEPDKAIIDSIELVNALVVEPADAWQLIATSFGLAVSTNNVSVSEDGRIFIRDRELANRVKEIIAAPGGGASNNFLCGNIFCAEV